MKRLFLCLLLLPLAAHAIQPTITGTPGPGVGVRFIRSTNNGSGSYAEYLCPPNAFPAPASWYSFPSLWYRVQIYYTANGTAISTLTTSQNGTTTVPNGITFNGTTLTATPAPTPTPTPTPPPPEPDTFDLVAALEGSEGGVLGFFVNGEKIGEMEVGPDGVGSWDVPLEYADSEIEVRLLSVNYEQDGIAYSVPHTGVVGTISPPENPSTGTTYAPPPMATTTSTVTPVTSGGGAGSSTYPRVLVNVSGPGPSQTGSYLVSLGGGTGGGASVTPLAPPPASPLPDNVRDQINLEALDRIAENTRATADALDPGEPGPLPTPQADAFTEDALQRGENAKQAFRTALNGLKDDTGGLLSSLTFPSLAVGSTPIAIDFGPIDLNVQVPSFVRNLFKLALSLVALFAGYNIVKGAFQG